MVGGGVEEEAMRRVCFERRRRRARGVRWGRVGELGGMIWMGSEGWRGGEWVVVVKVEGGGVGGGGAGR